MSYGIICRIGLCRSYAQFVVRGGDGRESYACDICSVPFARVRSIAEHEHGGPEGMKSIDEQKANRIMPYEMPYHLQAPLPPPDSLTRAERRRLQRKARKGNQ